MFERYALRQWSPTDL